MKKTNLLKDLRALSGQELKARGVKAAEELMKLRFQRKTGQLKQTHRIAELRHEIARINTFIRQSVLAGADKN